MKTKITLSLFIGAVTLTTWGCSEETSDTRSARDQAILEGIPGEAIEARMSGDAGEVSDTNSSAGLVGDICASKGRYTFYEWINAVKIDSFEHASGSDKGYASNEDPVHMKPGAYKVSLTPGYKYSSYNERWSVWVDLDGDGSFSPAERLLKTSGRGLVSGTIQIPDNARRGATTMRVSMRWGAEALSCGTFTWGEVQDYAIVIDDKPWTNSVNKLDVTGDLCLSPSDTLAMSNALRGPNTNKVLPGVKPPDQNFVDISGDGKFTPTDVLRVVNAQGRGEMKGCFEKPGVLKVFFPKTGSSDLARADGFALNWGADHCAPMQRQAAKNPAGINSACGLAVTATPYDDYLDTGRKFAEYTFSAETDYTISLQLVEAPDLPENQVCVDGCIGNVIKRSIPLRLIGLKPGQTYNKQLEWGSR